MLTPTQHERRRVYWRANVRLITILLAIWAFVSIGCSILFVEFLNQISLGNVPLGFWMAQQGSIITFVILIAVYVWRMERIDKKFDEEEAAEEKEAASR